MSGPLLERWRRRPEMRYRARQRLVACLAAALGVHAAALAWNEPPQPTPVATPLVVRLAAQVPPMDVVAASTRSAAEVSPPLAATPPRVTRRAAPVPPTRATPRPRDPPIRAAIAPPQRGPTLDPEGPRAEDTPATPSNAGIVASAPIASPIAPQASVIETPRAPAVTTPPRLDANYLANPPPDYPRLSRRMNEAGRVLLDVTVEPDGRASAVKVARSSGYERLDRAAVEAVRRWRFVPAHEGDRPVSGQVSVPLVFELRQAG